MWVSKENKKRSGLKRIKSCHGGKFRRLFHQASWVLKKIGRPVFGKGTLLVSWLPLCSWPTPCQLLPCSSTPEPPTPPFLSVALEGRTWVSIQTWKCELPLSPQNVIISENLGHTTTEKVTLPTSFSSVARHVRLLSEYSFSWTQILASKPPPSPPNGIAACQRAAAPTTTQVQWTDFAENTNSLNIWCLAVFSLRWGGDRQSKQHVLIRVSILIWESRINFFLGSAQRRICWNMLKFPCGILLTHLGSPLNWCFLEGYQLHWFFSQHSISLCSQVFTLH